MKHELHEKLYSILLIEFPVFIYLSSRGSSIDRTESCLHGRLCLR